MNFNQNFNHLNGKRISLKIIENHPGDDKMLPFYYYSIMLGRKEIGKISIRIGYNFHSYFNGNIGYEVDSEYRNNRYATEAVGLVLPVAAFHKMDYIIISCAGSNLASQKVIEHTGAELIDRIIPPKEYFGWHEGIEEQNIYKLWL